MDEKETMDEKEKSWYDFFPGWPGERQWVMIFIFASFWGMLGLAYLQPQLWKEELYKLILQAFAIQGIISMICAFFYSANKNDEQKSQNTETAFRAIRETAAAARESASAAAAATQLQEGPRDGQS